MVRLLSAMALSVAFCVPASAGVVFSNTTPISIPGTFSSGPAAPYPSTISVSGLTGNIVDVNVTITSLSHTFSGDIDMLLVGPNGGRLVLGTDLGGNANASDVTITFDDSAASALTTFTVSGTFRPEGDALSTFVGLFPGGGSDFTSLGGFNGAAGNGNWSLYISDDQAGDVGRLGGWSLNITTGGADVPEPATLPLLGAAVLGLAALRRRRA